MNRRQARAEAYALAAAQSRIYALLCPLTPGDRDRSPEERALVAAALAELATHLERRAARMRAMDTRQEERRG